MAKTKSGGSTKLGRDSASKRLGVKISDGGKVSPGMILVRQRGSRFWAGQGVRRGADDTLYAHKSGIVKFKNYSKKKFDGSKTRTKIITISPALD